MRKKQIDNNLRKDRSSSYGRFSEGSTRDHVPTIFTTYTRCHRIFKLDISIAILTFRMTYRYELVKHFKYYFENDVYGSLHGMGWDSTKCKIFVHSVLLCMPGSASYAANNLPC